MKKIWMIIIALLLSGCIKDDTTFTSHEVDTNFTFNKEQIFMNVYFKHRAGLGGDVYDIRMASEPAAYFLSASSLLQVKLNDVEIKEFQLYERRMDEREHDSIYHLNLQFRPSIEEAEKVGGVVTSLSFSLGNKEIYRYEHSPMYLEENIEQFTIEERIVDTQYELTNHSNSTLEIASLYLEDNEGKQVLLEAGQFQLLKEQSTMIELPEHFFIEQEFVGELGVYAQLKNGETLYLNKIPKSYFELNAPLFKKFEEKVNKIKS